MSVHMMSITWKDMTNPPVGEDEGKQEVSDKVSLREQLAMPNQEGEVHWEKGSGLGVPFTLRVS